MNIILFGPPGVGKSTLIGILKSEGFRAIDLEDIYPHKIRFQLPSYLDGVILGGADLNPARNYKNAKKILLYIPQDKYEYRRRVRDAKIPSKRNQMMHNIENWAHNDYDFILDASGTARNTANKIKEVYNAL